MIPARARSPIGIAAFLLALPCVLVSAEDSPGWLKEAARITLPQYGPKVKTVVLLNEEHTVVGDSGKLTTTTRTAIKILARQSVDVSFYEQYDSGAGKVKEFSAWMIPPAGKTKKYGKDEILDVACALNDVYNECRQRLVSGKRDSEFGAVFGYESVVERQLFSQQLMFHFQDSSPVRLARFLVTTPAGWELKSASFNGAPTEPAPAGGTYTWQMENLPEIETEPAAPSPLTLVPWVGVNVIGPGSKHPVLSWGEAARLLHELNEGQADSSDALAAKALSLTASAANELEKIRAIGRFTQQVNYVSIQVNVSKGGGYRPHPATQVFQKLYGDCKDKANLTRAMLRAIGISSYPVAIYSGDRTHVTEQWPSLGAFNHAVLAIRVGPETQAPAVLEVPRLGRLLLFDPTNPYVPVGYIPDHEQASLALVGAPDGGILIRVPVGLPRAETRQREVQAVLQADGSISGSFIERRSGESYAAGLSMYRGRSKADYSKMVERWVGRSVSGATSSGIEVVENDGEFLLKGQFDSPRYAQSPQPGMLVVRAALLRHGESLHLTEKTRKYPVVVDTDALQETVRLALPQEFKVDELPPPISIDSPFGKYTASWTPEQGSVVFRRKLELPAQSVPASQYAEFRRFLDVAFGSAELPIVLIK